MALRIRHFGGLGSGSDDYAEFVGSGYYLWIFAMSASALLPVAMISAIECQRWSRVKH